MTRARMGLQQAPVPPSGAERFVLVIRQRHCNLAVHEDGTHVVEKAQRPDVVVALIVQVESRGVVVEGFRAPLR